MIVMCLTVNQQLAQKSGFGSCALASSVCACVRMRVRPFSSKCQKLISDIFLSLSTPYFLRRCNSLNLKLSDLLEYQDSPVSASRY